MCMIELKKNPLYIEAFRLMADGKSVMPVGKDKKPLLKAWKQYQTTPATEEEITRWWSKMPSANIGIITGKVSGIIVVDVDTYAGAKDIFPETFTVKTGNGGLQKYYQYVPGFTISASGYPNMPHVDLRSDGGFVVAALSVTDYLKDGKKAGGKYEVIKNIPLAQFPIALFPQKKVAKKMSELLGVATGGRNDSMASFAGKLLRTSAEKEWEEEVWPAVERANKTYTPPLPQDELRATYDSIVKKEKERLAGLVVSTIQVEGGPEVKIPLRKASNGMAYKDMANALAVLKHHPFYKDTIKYNQFKQEIEYRGEALQDEHLVKMQYFMQSNIGLSSMSQDTVKDAVQFYAAENSYDEVQDWVKTLVWDKTPRLATWIAKATGVDDDDYHAGIGSQWFMGLMSRIMHPGSVFDYVLVMVGPQGIGKTSLFRIIGGPWYKNYTGAMDNKDFYLALRGALIIDLDEGASLSRSDSIKIKSIITNTHDEYRAPYGRLMKKYPRRFVFSMSTNDTEPFRDVTGNRRYWTVDTDKKVDFVWLEENRDQLFAEAYHNWVNKIKVVEAPAQKLLDKQEEHLPEDAWTDMVRNEVQKSILYCTGSEDYFTTAIDVYTGMFGADKLDRFTGKELGRVTSVFKQLGLHKIRSMVDGERKVRWYLTPKKSKELKDRNAPKQPDANAEFEALGEPMKF